MAISPFPVHLYGLKVMSLQSFIEIQCTRLNGNFLSRRAEQSGTTQFPFRRNCYGVLGAIAALLTTLQTELTTETIYRNPAAFSLNLNHVDQWGAAIAVFDLDPHFGPKSDRLAWLGDAS